MRMAYTSSTEGCAAPRIDGLDCLEGKSQPIRPSRRQVLAARPFFGFLLSDEVLGMRKAGWGGCLVQVGIRLLTGKGREGRGEGRWWGLCMERKIDNVDSFFRCDVGSDQVFTPAPPNPDPPTLLLLPVEPLSTLNARERYCKRETCCAVLLYWALFALSSVHDDDDDGCNVVDSLTIVVVQCHHHLIERSRKGLKGRKGKKQKRRSCVGCTVIAASFCPSAASVDFLHRRIYKHLSVAFCFVAHVNLQLIFRVGLALPWNLCSRRSRSSDIGQKPNATSINRVGASLAQKRASLIKVQKFDARPFVSNLCVMSRTIPFILTEKGFVHTKTTPTSSVTQSRRF